MEQYIIHTFTPEFDMYSYILNNYGYEDLEPIAFVWLPVDNQEVIDKVCFMCKINYESNNPHFYLKTTEKDEFIGEDFIYLFLPFCDACFKKVDLLVGVI